MSAFPPGQWRTRQCAPGPSFCRSGKRRLSGRSRDFARSVKLPFVASRANTRTHLNTCDTRASNDMLLPGEAGNGRSEPIVFQFVSPLHCGVSKPPWNFSMSLRRFYLVMSVLGAVVPWIFFASFFAENGYDIPLFVSGLFSNGAAGGFSTDVMISIGVFWVWSRIDAQQHSVRNWWLVLPAGALVGLSLALPLYLYFRQDIYQD